MSQRPIPHQLAPEERHNHRKLTFDGAHNFRDLGGYETEDGHALKWGMVYRADKLSALSDADKAFIQQLNLKLVVDFRAPSELASDPAPDLSAYGARVESHAMDVVGAKVHEAWSQENRKNITPEEMGDILVFANRQMIERFTSTYRTWIHLLLDESNYPMVFHCTAGKDRTGLGAALILRAVGVPWHTALEDYLATNHYTADKIDQILDAIMEHDHFGDLNREALKTLFAVEERYLQEAFTAIDEIYGSLEDYFEKGLGLNSDKRQALRELLLEPAPSTST